MTQRHNWYGRLVAHNTISRHNRKLTQQHNWKKVPPAHAQQVYLSLRQSFYPLVRSKRGIWSKRVNMRTKKVKECLPERLVIFLSAFFEGILQIPTWPEREGYGVKGVYATDWVKECLPERLVIFLSAFFEGFLLIPTWPESSGIFKKQSSLWVCGSVRYKW
jgi:hypothetical protein